MSIPNPIPHKTLYINDYICSCYAFVFIFEFSEYISKHILQFHDLLCKNTPYLFQLLLFIMPRYEAVDRQVKDRP